MEDHVFEIVQVIVKFFEWGSNYYPVRAYQSPNAVFLMKGFDTNIVIDIPELQDTNYYKLRNEMADDGRRLYERSKCNTFRFRVGEGMFIEKYLYYSVEIQGWDYMRLYTCWTKALVDGKGEVEGYVCAEFCIPSVSMWNRCKEGKEFGDLYKDEEILGVLELEINFVSKDILHFREGQHKKAEKFERDGYDEIVRPTGSGTFTKSAKQK